ncbi:hypothetical protein B566_EDAN013568 [Ephemera danica]|nr:hypothetical protein B566_EDAN013568 [Ephemera danica]
MATHECAVRTSGDVAHDGDRGTRRQARHRQQITNLISFCGMHWWTPGINLENTKKIFQEMGSSHENAELLGGKSPDNVSEEYGAKLKIRLVIEESLNQLPFTPSTVVTPTGSCYEGSKYQKGNCGVSIVRSGEAMEQGLRDCCRSIRIGKILVESDADTHEARVVYARFPEDIASRKEHNVPEENIILSNLFCTPFAAKSLTTAFPQVGLVRRLWLWILAIQHV